MVPDERKEVAPILGSGSFEAAVAFHKSLERPMGLLIGSMGFFSLGGLWPSWLGRSFSPH